MIDQKVLCSEQDEQALIGSLLIDPQSYTIVKPLVQADDFYLERHRLIWEAVDTIRGRGECVDYVTLADELEREDKLSAIGGTAYLSKLANCVPSALHAEQYAYQVFELAGRRRRIRAAEEAVKAAWDLSISHDEAMAIGERAILASRRDGKGAIDASALAMRLYDTIEDWVNNPLEDGQTRGLATGLRPLDQAIGGLKPGLYIVAGRTSMGKTALLLQIAANVARRGQRVLFFSPEMTEDQLGLRLACSEAGICQDELERGAVEQEEYSRILQALGSIASWPLTIRTGPLNSGDVRAIVQQEGQREPVILCIVDGLQLMASSRSTENRNLELGAISRDLHIAAQDKHIMCPIITAHQLNRSVDYRADKRPQLSDLRESGQLEENADVVWMLYREGYYNPGHERAQVAEIWIQKNRLGGPRRRMVQMFWHSSLMRFEVLEHSHGEVTF